MSEASSQRKDRGEPSVEKDGTLEAPPSQQEAELIFEHFRQVMEIGAGEPASATASRCAQTAVHVHLTDAHGPRA